jgi:dihydrofolate reductase
MRSVTNKNISIIVAIAENNAIGKNNRLLWKLSDDLKRFKKITTGHTVIMGRRTFESLPDGALSNRINLVISDRPGEAFKNCRMAYSIEEALELCSEKEESFVIGGGMIYKQFLPHARRLYLTKVHEEFDADTFFPEINYDEWNEISRESILNSEKNEYPHSFIVYERKS